MRVSDQIRCQTRVRELQGRRQLNVALPRAPKYSNAEEPAQMNAGTMGTRFYKTKPMIAAKQAVVNVRRARRLPDAAPRSVRPLGSAGGDLVCWWRRAESRTGTQRSGDARRRVRCRS